MEELEGERTSMMNVHVFMRTLSVNGMTAIADICYEWQLDMTTLKFSYQYSSVLVF